MSEPTTSEPWWTRTPPAQVRRPWRARLIGLAVSVIVMALVVPAAVFNPEAQPRVTPGGSIQQPASLEALAAGCTGEFQRPAPEPGTVGWVPLTTSYQPEFVPATGGNFARRPLSNGSSTYRLDQRRIVALLYRDWTVVWVKSTADQSEVTQLATYLESLPEDARVAAVPWPQDELLAWTSPTPVPWAFTRWGTVQYCAEFSRPVAEAFVANKGAPAPGRDLPLKKSGPRATVATGSKS